MLYSRYSVETFPIYNRYTCLPLPVTKLPLLLYNPKDGLSRKSAGVTVGSVSQVTVSLRSSVWSRSEFPIIVNLVSHGQRWGIIARYQSSLSKCLSKTFMTQKVGMAGLTFQFALVVTMKFPLVQSKFASQWALLTFVLGRKR